MHLAIILFPFLLSISLSCSLSPAIVGHQSIGIAIKSPTDMLCRYQRGAFASEVVDFVTEID